MESNSAEMSNVLSDQNLLNPDLIIVDGKQVSRTSMGKRKFHNKSKTGCDNCKRRRVKCDEGKPSCKKCQNMKLDCIYSPPKQRKRKRSPKNNNTTKGSVTKSHINNKSNNSIITNNNGSTINSSRNSSNDSNNALNMLESLKMIQNQEPLQQLQQLQKLQFMQQQLQNEKLLNMDNSNGNNNLSGSNSTNNLAASLLGLANNNGTSPNTNSQNNNDNGLLLPPLIADNSNTNAATISSGNADSDQPTMLSSNTSNTTQFPHALNNVHSRDKFMNAQNAYSPKLQSVGMTASNSLNFLLSPNRSNTNQSSNTVTAGVSQLNMQSNNHLLQQAQNQSQQQQRQETSLAGLANLNMPFNIETLSQLNKLNINLKTILPNLANQGIDATSMLANSGFNLNNLPFDFQELLGNKYSLHSNQTGSNSNNASATRATKASNAEEALAGMQQQQQRHVNKNLELKQILQQTKQQNESRAEDKLAKSANILSTLDSMNPLLKTSLENALNIEKTSAEDSLESSPKGLDKRDADQNESPITTSSNHSYGIGIGANTSKLVEMSNSTSLNLVDLKLFHHYCTTVWKTITDAGISGPEVWKSYIPELAFEYPFLMHAILAFSATHLSRTTPGLEDYVSEHRLNALKLLREAVLEISDDNTDALVASALILIMDSLANALNSTEGNTSAWIFHVKGAVTILTAVWPLPSNSKFSNIISVDLSGFSNEVNKENGAISDLVCFDESISDLYPVEVDSPYFVTLAYLDQLHREKNQLDFILRVFAFPALLDKTFLALLMTGDLDAMRIMRSYYKMLHNFTTEVKDKIWFLEGVSHVLPQDVDEYNGGGGMHMMLDFLGGGLPSMTTTNLSELM